MSLINDALRKARQAAAEHEAQQPETAFRPPVKYRSGGRGQRAGAIGMVAVAVAAGLAGAFATWWFLGRSDPTAEPGTSQTVIAAATAVPADATTGHLAQEPPVEISAEPSADGLASRSSAPPPEIRSESPPVGGTASIPTSGAQPTAGASAPVLDSEGRRVFVLDADLGYANLSLGYIVARSTNPFAEINGDDLYVGSEVEGFTVIAIETDRVILRDARGELILRVP